jgi:hypothetical protein
VDRLVNLVCGNLVGFADDSESGVRASISEFGHRVQQHKNTLAVVNTAHEQQVAFVVVGIFGGKRGSPKVGFDVIGDDVGFVPHCGNIGGEMVSQSRGLQDYMIRYPSHPTLNPAIGIHHGSAGCSQKSQLAVLTPDVAESPTEQNEERGDELDAREIGFLAKKWIQHPHRVMDDICALLPQYALCHAARFPHIQRSHPTFEAYLDYVEIPMRRVVNLSIKRAHQQREPPQLIGCLHEQVDPVHVPTDGRQEKYHSGH